MSMTSLVFREILGKFFQAMNTSDFGLIAEHCCGEAGEVAVHRFPASWSTAVERESYGSNELHERHHGRMHRSRKLRSEW